jgi:hypothetical protein
MAGHHANAQRDHRIGRTHRRRHVIVEPGSRLRRVIAWPNVTVSGQLEDAIVTERGTIHLRPSAT